MPRSKGPKPMNFVGAVVFMVPLFLSADLNRVVDNARDECRGTARRASRERCAGRTL